MFSYDNIKRLGQDYMEGISHCNPAYKIPTMLIFSVALLLMFLKGFPFYGKCLMAFIVFVTSQILAAVKI